MEQKARTVETQGVGRTLHNLLTGWVGIAATGALLAAPAWVALRAHIVESSWSTGASGLAFSQRLPDMQVNPDAREPRFPLQKLAPRSSLGLVSHANQDRILRIWSKADR